MALMRGVPYVYRNQHNEYVIVVGATEGSVALKGGTMEELAVMVVSSLNPQELADAVARVADKHGENFGAEAVMTGLGLPTAYDVVRREVEKIRNKGQEEQ